jgi:hypothetical protein
VQNLLRAQLKLNVRKERRSSSREANVSLHQRNRCDPTHHQRALNRNHNQRKNAHHRCSSRMVNVARRQRNRCDLTHHPKGALNRSHNRSNSRSRSVRLRDRPRHLVVVRAKAKNRSH